MKTCSLTNSDVHAKVVQRYRPFARLQELPFKGPSIGIDIHETVVEGEEENIAVPLL